MVREKKMKIQGDVRIGKMMFSSWCERASLKRAWI